MLRQSPPYTASNAPTELLYVGRNSGNPTILKLVPEARALACYEFGDSNQPIQILHRILFAVRSRFSEDRLARAAARSTPICNVRRRSRYFSLAPADFARDMQIFAVDHPASLIQTN